jgi:ArsR family transcriptional regulator
MTKTSDLAASAPRASQFLKAMTNPNRLQILCKLADGPNAVGQLESALGMRQPSLSQQLARLREDGLVQTRRNGKSVIYSLKSDEVRRLLDTLYDIFCAEAANGEAADRRGRARRSA